MAEILKYDKFIERMNIPNYTSKTAEYRRNIHKTVKDEILCPVDKVFALILKSVLKDTDKQDYSYFLKGGNFLTQKGIVAYVDSFILNKEFKYITLISGTYYIYSFKLKKIRFDFTKIIFTQSLKRPTTIAGFNGRLGSIKYKHEAKKKWSKYDQLFKKQARVKKINLFIYSSNYGCNNY